jgi:hypothetical protein
LHNRSIAQTQTKTLSFSFCLSLLSNQLHASQSCVFDCNAHASAHVCIMSKASRLWVLAPEGPGRRPVRGHAAWARTGNFGPSRADHGSVRGGHMLPERRTTRPPLPWQLFSSSQENFYAISHTFFFFFSFSFSSLVAW